MLTLSAIVYRSELAEPVWATISLCEKKFAMLLSRYDNMVTSWSRVAKNSGNELEFYKIIRKYTQPRLRVKALIFQCVR